MMEDYRSSEQRRVRCPFSHRGNTVYFATESGLKRHIGICHGKRFTQTIERTAISIDTEDKEYIKNLCERRGVTHREMMKLMVGLCRMNEETLTGRVMPI